MDKLTVVYEHHTGSNELLWPNGFVKESSPEFIDLNSFNRVYNFGAYYFPKNAYYFWFFTGEAHKNGKLDYKARADNERYVFPIHTYWHLWEEMQHKPLYIPDYVVNDAKKGNAKILLLATEAEQVRGDRVNAIKVTANKYSIPYESFVYVSSNYVQSDLLKTLGIKESYFNIYQYNQHITKVLNYIDSIKNGILNKQIRDKKFLCLNRVIRDHRLYIVNYLLEKGIEKESIVTLPDGHVGIVAMQLPGEDLPKQKLTEIELLPYPFLNNRLPLNYDFDDARNYINETNSVNVAAQISTYINIVTETICDSDSSRLCFTEKTFKPIMCMQPFILVGRYHSLRALRTMGYKTFEGFIDESYDEIVDTNERLKKITEVIGNLNNLTREQLAEMLYNMFPILEHNFNVYANSVKNNLVDLDDIIKFFNE